MYGLNQCRVWLRNEVEIVERNQKEGEKKNREEVIKRVKDPKGMRLLKLSPTETLPFSWVVFDALNLA